MYEVLNKEKYEKLQKELIDVREGKSDRNISEILKEMKECVYFVPPTEEEQKDTEIENIIDGLAMKFERETGKQAVSTFTQGYCYYFAIMLKKIFKEEAEIYTEMGSGHHAIVKIGNNFYDINGNIKKKFDRNDIIRGKINPDDYLPTEGEFFLLFRDWCIVGRTKEEIEETEKICDEITEEMINQLQEGKKNKF